MSGWWLLLKLCGKNILRGNRFFFRLATGEVVSFGGMMIFLGIQPPLMHIFLFLFFGWCDRWWPRGSRFYFKPRKHGRRWVIVGFNEWIPQKKPHFVGKYTIRFAKADHFWSVWYFSALETKIEKCSVLGVCLLWKPGNFLEQRIYLQQQKQQNQNTNPTRKSLPLFGLSCCWNTQRSPSTHRKKNLIGASLYVL